jgi:hypothetical protein
VQKIKNKRFVRSFVRSFVLSFVRSFVHSVDADFLLNLNPDPGFL